MAGWGQEGSRAGQAGAAENSETFRPPPLQARSLQCDRHDRVPGLMRTMAAVHHKEWLQRIVSGPSRLPPKGFMRSTILKRYHASVGKSVNDAIGPFRPISTATTANSSRGWQERAQPAATS